MKKKVAVVLSAFLMLFALVACGGGSGLEGKWKMTSAQIDNVFNINFTQIEQYGSLYFQIGGGEITLEMEEGPSLDEAGKAMLEMVQSLATSLKMNYEVRSDTEIALSMTLFGDTQEKTVSYTLDGDTLVMGGATFTRQ